MIRRIWFGLGGGLIAGALVGLGEALFILAGSPTGEYVALVYASLLYGGIGLGMGAGVGVGLALLGLLWKKLSDPLAYTLGFLGVLGPLILGGLFLAGEGGLWSGALAGVFAMAGLWFADDAFVRAGQSVPLS